MSKAWVVLRHGINTERFMGWALTETEARTFTERLAAQEPDGYHDFSVRMVEANEEDTWPINQRHGWMYLSDCSGYGIATRTYRWERRP